MNPEPNRELEGPEAVERLRRDIQSGIDQIERGEVYDAEEVFDELLRDLPEPYESEE